MTGVTRLLAGGDPAAAFDDAVAHRADFPERSASWLGYCAALAVASGRAEEALPFMAEAVAAGGWWSPSDLDDLAPLHQHPDYAALAATMTQRYAAALADARAMAGPRLEVIETTTPRAVVVALHMYGVPGGETAGIWAPLADAGIAVIVPESTLRDGDGRPTWGDPDLARRDVDAALARADEVAPGVPLVLAGGSQGAVVAAERALSGDTRAVGFVGVVAAPRTLPSPVAAVRGALVAGGADPMASAGITAFHEQLAAAGVDSHLVVVPDLPHVFPDDWATLGAELVDGVLARP